MGGAMGGAMGGGAMSAAAAGAALGGHAHNAVPDDPNICIYCMKIMTE